MMDKEYAITLADMDYILSHAVKEVQDRIPPALREHIIRDKDPDYVSTVCTDKPLERQLLRPATSAFISMLRVTYLADDAAERREVAEQLRENEGKPPFTEEEYQDYLDTLEIFNTLMGPMPDWEDSRAGRSTQPKSE